MADENTCSEWALPTDFPARVLHFPKDRSVGWLIYNVSEEENDQGWEYFADARGEVTVPSGKYVILDVDWNVPADLSCLATFERNDLQKVQLRGVTIQDDQFRYLSHLTGLRRILVVDTPISDAALTYLGDLSNLASVSLDGTRITDDGLKLLYSLTRLRYVSIAGPTTTKSGIDALQRALPNCKIRWRAR